MTQETKGIRIFENEEFGKIRAVEIDGEPWFVGKDVAKALGYERESKAVVDRVDEEDRKMIDSKGQSQFGIELGQRGGWVINESGVYSLILSSKLPKAKEFKRWILDTVMQSKSKSNNNSLSDMNTQQNVYNGCGTKRHNEVICENDNGNYIVNVITNEVFGEFRYIEINDMIYFVAADVCKSLGIQNVTQAIQQLADDERSMFNIGRQGKANCVNEYGLYNLILASRKREAKEFKRWITHEVLPSIRKHGGYILGQETLSDDELIAKALVVAQNKLAERDKIIAQQNAKLEEDKPKVFFAEAVDASNDSILIRELAKMITQNGYKIGQNKLFDWLRDNGYLIKGNSQDKNQPTQSSMEQGLFEVKETIIQTPDGDIKTRRTTKVTGKGQLYFINKFCKGKK